MTKSVLALDMNIVDRGNQFSSISDFQQFDDIQAHIRDSRELKGKNKNNEEDKEGKNVNSSTQIFSSFTPTLFAVLFVILA